MDSDLFKNKFCVVYLLTGKDNNNIVYCSKYKAAYIEANFILMFTHISAYPSVCVHVHIHRIEPRNK